MSVSQRKHAKHDGKQLYKDVSLPVLRGCWNNSS